MRKLELTRRHMLAAVIIPGVSFLDAGGLVCLFAASSVSAQPLLFFFNSLHGRVNTGAFFFLPANAENLPPPG